MYDSDPRLAHDRRRERADELIEQQKSMHELMDSLECNTTKELKRLCKVYGHQGANEGPEEQTTMDDSCHRTEDATEAIGNVVGASKRASRPRFGGEMGKSRYETNCKELRRLGYDPDRLTIRQMNEILHGKVEGTPLTDVGVAPKVRNGASETKSEPRTPVRSSVVRKTRKMPQKAVESVPERTFETHEVNGVPQLALF
jgi:hypothetical protein